MRSDCGDIRFTDSDGATSLSYWLEPGCNSANTKIWVKVPNIPASSTKTIYVYYGNPSATSLSKMWHNIKHLNIYNGVFNYNTLLGVNGYHSREMQHRLGVAAGDYHTCVLKSNGNVDCYGRNGYGQAYDYTGGDAKNPFRKYTSPEPTTSIGNEDVLITQAGSPTSWSWKVPNQGEKIRSGSATNWQWITFQNDGTGIAVPRGSATNWQWGP